MPYSINGFGTALCGSKGHLSWAKKGWIEASDYDAVECVCMALLPVIPYRPVHVYQKNSQGAAYSYQRIPIRWSFGLVFRAFLARWLWLPMIAGAIMLIVFIADHIEKGWQFQGNDLMFLVGCVLAMSIPCCVWTALYFFDRRNRNFRRVMGPSMLGTSDPVTWKEEMLFAALSPQELYQTSTFEQAVDQCLANGEYGKAMFAARMSAALESRSNGEAMTDQILNDPYVAEHLPEVHRNPLKWPAVFGKDMSRQVDGESAPNRTGNLADDWTIL